MAFDLLTRVVLIYLQVERFTDSEASMTAERVHTKVSFSRETAIGAYTTNCWRGGLILSSRGVSSGPGDGDLLAELFRGGVCRLGES